MKVKIGDMVRYREWQKGDPDPSTLPKHRHGWSQSGIVFLIGEGKFGKGLEPMCSYLNESGELVEAAQRDVEVINESR